MPDKPLEITNNYTGDESPKLASRASIRATNIMETLLNDSAVNDTVAAFIEAGKGLDAIGEEEPEARNVSYWAIDVHAPDHGRYQLSMTKLNGESPHDKVLRFKTVLSRILRHAGNAVTSEEHKAALQRIAQLADEALTGEVGF